MLNGWKLVALGHAGGWAESCGQRIEPAHSLSLPAAPERVFLHAEGGKLADSEDSFMLLCCAIDPENDDFSLQATLSAKMVGSGFDQQSGFGIMAVDTIESTGKRSRHRNQLLVGCYGDLVGGHVLGARLVGGYRDPGASSSAGRIVDESRSLASSASNPFDGSPHVLSLQKTDEGFRASCDGMEIAIPGCDFLMQQERGAIYVGFAAARNVEISISDIRFQSFAGRASHTPEGTLAFSIPDYPFPRRLLERGAGLPVRRSLGSDVLFASPFGTPEAAGTRAEPLALDRALTCAAPGTRIVLLDGVYASKAPLIISSACSGTIDAPIILEAEHPRAAILDGSSLAGGQPLCVVDADFWQLKGLVFRNSPLSGLVICGNLNRIENCEACSNGDTGILIISRPGAERDEWPRRNMVVGCDSHRNCDAYRSNADGFGAKLRVGKGNVFYRCIAHHNIDDGFDLYTKSLYGPIEPVEIDSCVAYCNGNIQASDDGGAGGRGSGFKLGGEVQPVAHDVWNCIAFSNVQAGFTANSNPSVSLHFCTVADNGADEEDDFRLFFPLPHRSVKEGLLTATLGDEPPDECVSRRADGSIAVAKPLEPRMVGGQREGASPDIRKRVLILVDSLYGGGAERTACRLANALSAHHDVFLMYFNKKDATYHIDSAVTLIDASIPWPKPLPTAVGLALNRSRMFVKRARLLTDARKRYAIDTTVSLLSLPNLLNGLCRGGRRIVCERNDPSRKPLMYRLRSVLGCMLADYAVFQTEKVKGMYPERVRRKSCIIPNPDAVTCLAEPSDAHKIVTVGRLHPQKNYALLIKAFERFRRDHSGYTLHIFGRGKELERLVQLAASLGLEDSVVFEGFHDDVHAAIRDAQMFVLSSDYEGMSNALIEAMMMGLPCISTACTGSDELITHEVDGLLVPVGDEEALCSAMGRLADDATLRAELARNARIRAMDYDIDDVIRKWERIL